MSMTGWLYRDGSPKYRWEAELEPLKGNYRKPSIISPPPLARGTWMRVEDPVQHCVGGNSLALLGSPGTGKTYMARQIVEALRRDGKMTDIISKTHAACANIGMGAKTADDWVRRHIRHGQLREVDWLVIEELTQIDIGL